MGRIRVCQLISSLQPGCAERCVSQLAGGLDRSMFVVEAAALRGGGRRRGLIDAGVRVTVPESGRGLFPAFPASPVKLGALVRFLRAGGFDVLHTHLYSADVAGRLAARLAPVGHVVHTVHVPELRRRSWSFGYARLFAGSCDRIVCASPWARDRHGRLCGLPGWRYEVIPHGIDTGAFSRDRRVRRRLRRRWGVGEAEPVFAFVGRLEHQSGIHTLLGAMSHLAARGSGQWLVVAGDGPKRYMVENYAAYGEGGRRARYMRSTADVRDVLSAADVFVMPELVESSPMEAAEAMAASLPVVASAVPGVREVLTDQQTALLVPPGDVLALSGAMERIASDADLRKRMARRARREVRRQWRLEDTIAAYEDLYARVVGPPPPGKAPH